MAWQTISRDREMIAQRIWDSLFTWGNGPNYMWDEFSSKLEDVIVVSDVGWEGDQGSRPVHFRDAFSAKGSVTEWQFDVAGSRDIMDYMTDRMMITTETDLPGDAGILATYSLERDGVMFIPESGSRSRWVKGLGLLNIGVIARSQ